MTTTTGPRASASTIDEAAATAIGLEPIHRKSFVDIVRDPSAVDLAALAAVTGPSADARVLLSLVKAEAARTPFAATAMTFLVFVLTQLVDSAGVPDMFVLVVRSVAAVAVGALLVRFFHNQHAAHRWQTLLEPLA
ncbi:hypothetical protein QQX09_03985 [Demequina sp. SYSU T00192]|uniref:Uncharacterized protein n=1 Tax=Demequina litoralis TaxID=3051660 RepID=A0ABT8G7B9_9MICO|nr:hypothetical protein [Demequina sp. SYSU T00192]MDN4475015.1 hypothetical protein [Demequina sp. SYSU T00192]